MSLYAEYVKERLGKDVIETDEGFVVCVITNDRFYIEDIFVRKESRKKGVAQAFGNEAIEWAKRLKFKEVWGSVFTRAKNSEYSMNQLLKFGFKIVSANQEMIWLKKEI